jgi:hypothetical protein
LTHVKTSATNVLHRHEHVRLRLGHIQTPQVWYKLWRFFSGVNSFGVNSIFQMEVNRIKVHLWQRWTWHRSFQTKTDPTSDLMST